MSSKTEISVLPPKEKALDVFSSEKGLDPYLAKVREEIDSFVPDVSTKKGRDSIASIAYKVAQSKTALDKLGKQLVDDLKEKPRLIDSERKRMRDLLDSWKEEVRKPLTEWEDAENSRVAAHESAIEEIEALAVSEDVNLNRLTSEQLKSALSDVELVKLGEHWEEFEAKAARAKEAAIEKLKAFIAAQEKYETEQDELERLRKESAEREERERVERIKQEAIEAERVEAEKRATEERERVEREREEERRAVAERERKNQMEIERATREKAEAEARAIREKHESEERQRQAVEAERKRIEDERLKAEADAAKKAANRAHQQKINREALEDMEALGIETERAKKLISDIARNSIRNITINY